jgi:hypothetical protein
LTATLTQVLREAAAARSDKASGPSASSSNVAGMGAGVMVWLSSLSRGALAERLVPTLGRAYEPSLKARRRVASGQHGQVDHSPWQGARFPTRGRSQIKLAFALSQR